MARRPRSRDWRCFPSFSDSLKKRLVGSRRGDAMTKLNAENRDIRSRKLLQNPMRLAVPISIALVLVGCNVDQHLSSPSLSVVTQARRALNRLAANQLSSNRLA